jgi:dephospho-CoA kinase
MHFIGITGGVGSGKSAVLDHLRENPRFKVSEADRIAEDLLLPGSAVFNSVIEILGKDVLSEDGTIDRKKMASLIFNDRDKLKKINGIIHPAVRDKVQEEKNIYLRSGECDIYFLEAALLIECGYDKICDELWYIYAEPEVRKKRLKDSRGYSDEKTDSIMKSQLDDSIFREKCRIIIDNSGPLNNTLAEVDRITSGYSG